VKAALLSHLASVDAPTGAERSLGLLARGLSGRGHEVVVTAPGPWSMGAALEAAEIEVATIPVRPCWLVQYGPQPLWRQTARGVRYALPDRGYRELRSCLGALDPDVVHVNCLPHLRGAAAARSLGLPVVWHIREILPPGRRRRWFAGRLRVASTRIVAVSEAVAGWLREEDLGELVEVIHNGADPPTDSVDRDGARGRFDLPPEAVVVGLFSQLVAHKGSLDFVRAAQMAAARDPRLHFLIAGSGRSAFVEHLRGEIAAGPAADRIRLVPPQDEIWPLLAAVDVVALTTRWPDPLPRVVMEAMAVRLPVVAYDGGGVPEMVVAGETGIVLPSGDIEGLSAAMLELAGDGRLRRRLGDAGYRRARRLFSVEEHVDRMERALLSAASAAASG
jgi:glycosyltransferase involved in cell wall biosynthesis